jgi:uncharacterized protein (TIGR02145 family)
LPIFGFSQALTPSSIYLRDYATNNTGTASGNQQSFTTTATSQTVTDIDGNIYNTVKIGTQVWMSENLKTSRYRNGGPIPFVISNTAWRSLTAGAWTYYDHVAANNAIYGKLYNWYTTQGDTLCPTNWRIPNEEDWTTLTTYLGGQSVAGGKMKSTDTTFWNSPNTGATNESGFSALPSGYLLNGSFRYKRNLVYFWSTTQYSYFAAYDRHLNYYLANLNRGIVIKTDGLSIRCLKD